MPLSLPLTFIGGLGNTYAQFRGAKEAKQGQDAYTQSIEQLLKGQRADIEGLLSSDAYRNYFDTAEAQSALEHSRQQLAENADRIRGGVSRSGGTTESAVAAQTASNRGYADIMNRMAARGTQYNQNARRTLLGARQGLAAQQGQHATNLYSMAQDRAQGWSKAGQGFSQGMTGLAESTSAQAESILKLLGIM